MKSSKKAGVALLIIAVVLLTAVVANSRDLRASNVQVGDTQLNLTEGKNNVSLEHQIFVNEFVSMNRDISTVSYFDEYENTTVGYVNVFGGVGKNFVIEPGEVYEVIAKKNITITF